MTFHIRDIASSDEPAWRALWAAYLVFYEQDLGPEVTDYTWARMMDGSTPYWCLVAEQAGEMLGFALNQTQCSSWTTAPIVYLEDLYVSDAARGKGVGQALIEASAAQAKAMNARDYYWQTEHDNTRARGLYDKLCGGASKYVKYEFAL